MGFSKLSFIFIFLLLGTSVLGKDLSKYETDLIDTQIKKSFHLMIQLWQEEDYLLIYEFGNMKSKLSLSDIEFTQRMTEINWRPSTNKKDIKVENIDIIYKTLASIKVKITFINSILPDQSFQKQFTFPMILENDKWKFDLIQLIHMPF